MYDLLIWSYLKSLAPEQAENCSNILLGLSENVPDNFIANSESEELKAVYDDPQKFVTNQSAASPTFSFWVSYIEMMSLLLTFIRGTRESNWNLHLSSLSEMLPYFFAYDRVNYARYGSLYYAEICIMLADSHPEVHQAFVDQCGAFTYHAQDMIPFTGIACDQAIEQTVNRASKTSGGLIGLTLNRAAAQRWTLAQSQRAQILEATESFCNIKPSEAAVSISSSKQHCDAI